MMTTATPKTLSADAGAASPTSRQSRTHLANDAWEGLLTAHTTLMRQFAAEGSWNEVSMREYDVLYTLTKCTTPAGQPNPQRIGELGRNVLLSQPALSRLVDRLEARGLVERLPDPADARSVRIGLTASGREAQRIAGSSHGVSVTRTMTAALSPEELRTLIALTRKLQEATS
ncbi:MarR family winged helix-turn-helix transcriptional regulator [Demequina aurantiaca]|uniref:MarR family winged helix-turn-helix transcriptional regulator n=1 Tax=Demequina aurantiaca TaxID=676200 RepID=UPI000ABF8885|nr:MarR family transcriptional regulator [Demequina aurantiaca]